MIFALLGHKKGSVLLIANFVAIYFLNSAQLVVQNPKCAIWSVTIQWMTLHPTVHVAVDSAPDAQTKVMVMREGREKDECRRLQATATLKSSWNGQVCGVNVWLSPSKFKQAVVKNSSESAWEGFRRGCRRTTVTACIHTYIYIRVYTPIGDFQMPGR